MFIGNVQNSIFTIFFFSLSLNRKLDRVRVPHRTVIKEEIYITIYISAHVYYINKYKSSYILQSDSTNSTKKNIGIGKISLFYANFFLTVESTKKLHVVKNENKKIQKKLYIVSADQIPNLFIVPNRIGIS